MWHSSLMDYIVGIIVQTIVLTVGVLVGILVTVAYPGLPGALIELVGQGALRAALWAVVVIFVLLSSLLLLNKR